MARQPPTSGRNGQARWLSPPPGTAVALAQIRPRAIPSSVGDASPGRGPPPATSCPSSGPCPCAALRARGVRSASGRAVSRRRCQAPGHRRPQGPGARDRRDIARSGLQSSLRRRGRSPSTCPTGEAFQLGAQTLGGRESGILPWDGPEESQGACHGTALTEPSRGTERAGSAGFLAHRRGCGNLHLERVRNTGQAQDDAAAAESERPAQCRQQQHGCGQQGCTQRGPGRAPPRIRLGLLLVGHPVALEEPDTLSKKVPPGINNSDTSLPYLCEPSHCAAAATCHSPGRREGRSPKAFIFR